MFGAHAGKKFTPGEPVRAFAELRIVFKTCEFFGPRFGRRRKLPSPLVCWALKALLEEVLGQNQRRKMTDFPGAALSKCRRSGLATVSAITEMKGPAEAGPV